MSIETGSPVSATQDPTFLRDPGPASAAAGELRVAHALSHTGAQALSHRRANGAPIPSLPDWLDPKLAGLTSPAGMIDREVATDRIARAIKSREPIAIFGDYDCDGITAAAVMTTVIRALGGEARPLLATRTEGAYGLSNPAMARVRQSGATLLITCDCGSSDHERIADGKRAGIDSVVIDHHLVPAEPLPALAFLNPHRPECKFPFKYLASCGLALSMGAALRTAVGRPLDLRPLLDLVAIGTVADVAPLVEDNRALVRAGLRVLSSGHRPGMRALAELARIDLSRGMTSEDIGYRIAPRLNAPGRLADPDNALQLLLETDSTTAASLASAVEQAQLQRRALQGEIVAQAEADLIDTSYGALAGLVVARQGWHPGIVGIVAGKLAESTRKPVIVVALEGDTGRGSVRGPPNFPLYDALSRCRAELLQFGGHQAAAGVHVRADRIDALRAAWHEATVELSKTVKPDAGPPMVRLDPRDEIEAVLRDFDRFEPFGEGNPMPLVYLPDVRVTGGKNLKGHLKLELELTAPRRTFLSGIQFSRGDDLETVLGQRCTIIGALRRDTFRGGAELQIRSLSVKLEGT